MDFGRDEDAEERKPLDLVSVDCSPDRNAEEAIDEDAIKIFGDLEKILGDDPARKAKKEVSLHPTLVSRWKDWIVTGPSKDVINELTDKYPRTGNVYLEPPVLNPEVFHSLKEAAQKRDKHFVYAQRLAGTALSALGTAITSLLCEEAIDRLKLLELLSDAAKLMIEVHHKESSARIAYILPGMSKQIKAVLEETKPDTLLFGQGLTEKLQDAIALEKLGKELKAQQLPVSLKKGNTIAPGASEWKRAPSRYQGQHQGHHQGQRHQAQNNRARPGNRPGPNRNFHQKTRHTPYHSGPLRQQNQIKAVLEETKLDTLLFGQGLTEKLQDAIALEQLGKELKAQQLPVSLKKGNTIAPGTSEWKMAPSRYQGQHQGHHQGQRHQAQNNRARPGNRPGPNRNFHQKTRHTPYHSGPLRQQNQARMLNNRIEDHRRS